MRKAISEAHSQQPHSDQEQNPDQKKKSSPNTQQNLSRHSNSTQCINNDEEQDFNTEWLKIQNNQTPQFKRYRGAQKAYHRNNTESKLIENLVKSLSFCSSQNQQNQRGILHYVTYSAWIPYMHQKYQRFIYIHSQNWLSEFETDFQDLQCAVIDIIQKYYPRLTLRQGKYSIQIFCALSHTITCNPKWTQIHDIFIKIMSRLRIPLKLNLNLTPEIFHLPLNQDYSFKTQISIQKSLYYNKEVETKKKRLKQILRNFLGCKYPHNLQMTIQYCFLWVPYLGVEEMLQHTLFFTKYQLTQDEINEANIIIGLVKRLRTRDVTGFTDYGLQSPISQNDLCKKSWKFLFKKQHSFCFFNSLKVSHREINWQDLVSWNFMKQNTQIPISVKVQHNFIKVGIIRYDGTEVVKDYSNSDSILNYCFFSGRINRFHEVKQTEQNLFKKKTINKIILKLTQNTIIWKVFVQCGQWQEVKTIQQKFECLPQDKYKVIISFKKGEIKMFD